MHCHYKSKPDCAAVTADKWLLSGAVLAAGKNGHSAVCQCERALL